MAILILLATIGVAIVSYLAADRLVHPPREHRRATPAYRGVAFEDVSFTTDDGLKLAAWWMPARADDPQGTVVFLHGYGASKWQALGVAPFLHRNGWNVLAFDFRAHGWSEGAYTTFGIDETSDVRAAVAYALARDPDEPVALFGWSMGGATALAAAADMPEVRAVVVDSAFARLENVVSNSLPAFTGLPAFPFAPVTVSIASWMTHRDVDDAQPARGAATLGRPLLIIHGLEDTLVRADVDARELSEAAGGRAETWLVPDADHVNARRYHPQEYEQRVLGFLARHVAVPLAKA